MVGYVTGTPCSNVAAYLGVKQMNVTLHEDTEPRRGARLPGTERSGER